MPAMQMHSSTRLRWIWIAMFAIVLNALAPTISHALAAQSRSWEICLNDGTRISGRGEMDLSTFLAATDRSKAPPKPAMQMDMDDCDYCLPHAGTYGLLGATSAPALLPAGRALRPVLFYQSPQPLAVWSASIPRGPPAFA